MNCRHGIDYNKYCEKCVIEAKRKSEGMTLGGQTVSGQETNRLLTLLERIAGAIEESNKQQKMFFEHLASSFGEDPKKAAVPHEKAGRIHDKDGG